ncbi:DEAD/DEAH box helicase [Pontibacter mangrovi]|uniref:Restriction endonuclease n=2 Tax=Pseudomonadati TaxID=3379134 RepID=A0A501WS78_9RHOB|nr:DEAD/DEAH box helicase family protein [Pontibacter mangrovi]TPE41503.1 restriction endonuclease [Pontibacter mangrovi]TPE48636.1 restriction endonuclease [Amaricoccus solimangrovi]
MELKTYQQQVIQDLETFLEYTQQHKLVGEAFSKYWEDKIGPYNPLTGEGMRPYKNNVPGAASICIKVPTAGGKTFIACNALSTIFRAFPVEKPKAVVWLVPWSNLLDQTVKNLSDPNHPYRQKLDALFNHRVEVYRKDDLLQGANFNPTVVQEQLTIIVMSFASLRARRKEDRKVYQENGQLAQFAQHYKDTSHLLDNTDETALINVIRSLNPVVVVDESHNAESDLSVDMLQALNPSFLLDLTATPKENSNIISLVPAIELKKEHMVKLPVIVYNHHDKTEVVNSALHLQQNLEQLAKAQHKNGGRYIRPIVLFQAQPRTGEDNTTFDKLKQQLLKLGIPEEQIKIKTANKDELKGVDLMSEKCPVRFIITINALKEGWDCPFAYILASLADKSSAVDVEQILGRVLRQPYVMKHSHPLLNVSYVLTASAKFNETLQNIVKGLQASGFSSKDYRHKDALPEAPKPEETPQQSLNKAFFPEEYPETPNEDEIDTGRISYSLDTPLPPTASSSVISQIEQMAVQQVAETEQRIKEQEKSNTDNIFSEMGEKVQRYQMRDAFAETAQQIVLPQFFLEVPTSSIFDMETGAALLNQEVLLKGFRLSDEDTKVAFDSISSDMYKVDLHEAKKDDFTPSFAKIEQQQVKDPIAEYILAKPKESQVKDIGHQIMQLIGNMYPIAEQEVKIYVERILSKLTTEQLRDFLSRKYSYTDKIKKKIRSLADAYAEQRFNEQLKIGKITAAANWKFPVTLVPGALGAPVASSLYEREGSMNNFEQSSIMELSGLPNVLFWHRNLGRGKGFAINGFKSNHYPDFILYTKSGRVILLETKGDDRDNSDSEAKCRLGNQWAQLAGSGYNYFMVFESKAIEGAYNLNKAKELIGQL